MQPELGFLAAPLVLALIWLGIPHLVRARSTYQLSQRVRRDRCIALTYDDGPSANLTPKLLDLLARRKVPATFFLVGAEATQHPAIVERMLRDGHEVGNHSLNHLNAWKSWPIEAAQDVVAGQKRLKELGARTGIFRPPFGKSTLLTLIVSGLRRMKLAFWTVDSQDSWDRLSISGVLNKIDSAGGAVVLMHDFDTPRRGSLPEHHSDYVLELTESIIDYAISKGFRIVPFSSLLGAPASVMNGKQA